MMYKYILVALVSAVLAFIEVAAIFMNTMYFNVAERIHFQTKDGRFKFEVMPIKGIGFKAIEREFEKFKKENGLEDDDMRIYRTTRKNYLKISKWCTYKSLQEWRYPILM